MVQSLTRQMHSDVKKRRSALLFAAGDLRRYALVKTMEFLPLIEDGKKVYAGFGKRLIAAILDMFIWMPVLFINHYFHGINIPIAISAIILNAAFFSIYSIYFNLHFGGSLGKLAVGIRITKPNGTKIGMREAFLRSSIDIIYGVLFTIFQLYAINQLDSATYLMATSIERMRMISPLYFDYFKHVNLFYDIWYWSEIIVILFNKRNRALHDLIAGTVVIHKEYA